jgi:hypothetical protein
MAMKVVGFGAAVWVLCRLLPKLLLLFDIAVAVATAIVVFAVGTADGAATLLLPLLPLLFGCCNDCCCCCCVDMDVAVVVAVVVGAAVVVVGAAVAVDAAVAVGVCCLMLLWVPLMLLLWLWWWSWMLLWLPL